MNYPSQMKLVVETTGFDNLIQESMFISFACVSGCYVSVVKTLAI